MPTSSEDLFLHELQDMCYAEKTLAKVFPKLAKEAGDRELAVCSGRTWKETEKQVANLGRVFEQIGHRAEEATSPATLC